jgi:hypothetical protein
MRGAARRSTVVAAPGRPATGRRSFGREPGEIAPGVFWLSASGSNVYFVRSGLSWC